MERTPSPSRRVRTPPAPHHGIKYDNYEPYSPRRSSRVAAQNQLHREQPSSNRPRTTRAVTPTASLRKKSVLSPPTSPISPISPTKLRSPRSTRSAHPFRSELDSDLPSAPTPTRRFLAAMSSHGMLPTPVKTPRKRPIQSEDSLGQTARVLFPNRPATVEEAMPTPRKNRKITTYVMDGFETQAGSASGKIQIYTDSKDRVPDNSVEEDNPFVSRTTRSTTRTKALPQKPPEADQRKAKMFEDAKSDKGMVYMFRGRPTFRKYDDVASPSDEEHQSSGDELRHRAGPATRGLLKRSNIKPRILFQEEIARQRLERGQEEDDREAVTDVESPSRRSYKAALPANIAADVPASSSAAVVREITPPPTNRVKRQFSFESWSRVKSSSRASSASRQGKKRPGTPLEGSTDKRARSERSELSTSVLSTDDV